MFKKILILVLLFTNKCFSQSGPFARIQVSRSSMYIQEPFRVTITVMTSTWFTAPPVFSNLQIPNAFILPFDQTVPGMFTIGKKQYAGIQFYYIVFPYKEGKFTVPPFPIQVTGPPEGSAVSRKWNLRTREIPFAVKGVPESEQSDYWLVAKNVYVSENWNKPLSHLKVGDVIERLDVINAKGTLPQFIPPIPLDSMDWASEYPQDPVLRDERNDQDANGSRTQKTIYLLEKEGDFTIPEMTVSWWNPQSQRMLVKKTKSYRIHVQPNENLGILKTLKDSLSAKPISAPVAQAGIKKIAGLPWYLFYMYLLDALLSLFVIVILILEIIPFIRKKWVGYKTTEKYWFKQFQKSNDDPVSLINHFYAWWDRRKNTSDTSSVQNAIGKSEPQFLIEWTTTEKNVFAETKENDAVSLKKEAIALRENIYHAQTQDKANMIQDPWPTVNRQLPTANGQRSTANV